MIIIITLLSFIPAMNTYETALFDELNWKAVWPELKTKQRERENKFRAIKTMVLLLFPISV